MYAILALILGCLFCAACVIFGLRRYRLSNLEHNREHEFMDKIPFCIKMWDAGNNLVYCNQLTLDTFGFETVAQYLAGFKSLLPRLQPCGTLSSEKLDEMIGQAFETGSAHFEMIFHTIQGAILDSEVFLRRIHLDGADMVVGYFHDFSHSKKILDEKRLAEEKTRAKSRFLARMSHEIRTPMNVVVGLTEILLQNEEHSNETKNSLRRIQASGRMLVAIINDILDVSKVESGKMEMQSIPISVEDLIMDTIQLNWTLVGDKKLDFKLHIDPELPARIMGDEIRIKQVLNNVLSNAFKFTSVGMVSLSFVQRPGRLEITIKDTGLGMTQEELKSLFKNEFVRYNQEANRHVEGTGLGLSIAHQFVMLMNGTINADSEPGMGTVFVIGLPLRAVGDSSLGTNAVERIMHAHDNRIFDGEMRSITPMPHGRILVVDDVEINLEIMEGILEPYRVFVDTAQSGYAAIEKVRTGLQYDIIFMDHMMPGMDGIEVTRSLRDMGYTRPIVALTASATYDAHEMFFNNGFEGFIPKPVEIDKLHDCLVQFVQAEDAVRGAV